MRQQSTEGGHCESASQVLTVPVPLGQRSTLWVTVWPIDSFIWCHSSRTINSMYFYCCMSIWSSALNKLVASIQYKVGKWSTCRSYHQTGARWHCWMTAKEARVVWIMQSGNHKQCARTEHGSLHLCGQCHSFLCISKRLQYYGPGSTSTKLTPAEKGKLKN